MTTLDLHLAIALIALAVDAAIGYPAFLFRRLRHPVVWMGALLGLLERHLNRGGRRRLKGIAALLLLLLAVGGATAWISAALRALPFGFVLEALLAAALIAQRSLHDHVADVARALETDAQRGGEPAAGRAAVARIVGRDPASLDRAGVARAAVESLAENFSDGIVAPVFWLAVGGLPGIALYKAINTADSMIGHRTARYAAFGWAAARLDDLVNLPASRLAGLLLVLAALLARGTGAARAAWRVMRRDAPGHRSPNAGWPEAAMAGALGLRLAGPRLYGGARVDDPWLGEGTADLGAADIRRALALYRLACLGLFLAVLAGLALA